MNNKGIVTLLLLLYSLSVYSQNYYGYKDSKISLKIDSTKINVTTTIETNLPALLQEFDAVVEIKQIEKTENISGKIGLISLVSINGSAQISADSINKLNEYYMKNYSLSLDFDILLRYFTRKKK